MKRALYVILTLMGIGVLYLLSLQDKPVMVLAAFDKSGSVPQEMQTNHANLFETFVEPKSGYACIYRFGQRAELLFDAELAEFESIQEVLDADIKEKEAMPGRGTYFAPVLRAIHQRINEDDGDLPIVIFILTDGGCDDRFDTLRVATKLVKLPRLKAVLAGPVIPQVRLEIDDVLAPLKAAGKLVICGANDTRGALNKVERKLKEKQGK